MPDYESPTIVSGETKFESEQAKRDTFNPALVSYLKRNESMPEIE